MNRWISKNTTASEALKLLPLCIFALLIPIVFAACNDRAPQEYQASENKATFIGDDKCSSCHGGIVDTFHRTGMGRSISKFDPASHPEKFSSNSTVYDPNSNLSYHASIEDGQLAITEFRLSETGQREFERKEFADFVVGSGNATRSYMRLENGLLTEMPLTWYVDREIWDLSPGYSQNNFRFDRPIDENCLSCHSGPIERTVFTTNHYSATPQAISCERCHGPGSLHEEAQLSGLAPGEDTSIINPKKLDRAREMAVCQQCHLTGIAVYKKGESHPSFRPGQLVSENRSVFATTSQVDNPDQFGISSHAERLEKSKCFIESEMTCTTCHDPHVAVAELGKEWFNEACMTCHEDSAPEMTICADPAGKIAEANCSSCHMQKSGTSDIPHVTFTDHWIRRTLPSVQANQNPEFVLVKSNPEKLQLISDGTMSNSESERALAYFELFQTRHKHLAYTDSVESLLKNQLKSPEAFLALARSRMEKNLLGPAREVFVQGRAQFSGDAHLAFWSGKLAKDVGDIDLAIAEFQRAVEIQPLEPNFLSFLGQSLVSSKNQTQKKEGIEVLSSLVDLYPSQSPEAYNNMAVTQILKNDIDGARKNLSSAVALDPDLVEARVSLAGISLQQGQLDEAIKYGEQALQLDHSNLGALGNLATAYLAKGEKRKAREKVEALLLLSPGNPRALQLLETINL